MLTKRATQCNKPRFHWPLDVGRSDTYACIRVCHQDGRLVISTSAENLASGSEPSTVTIISAASVS